MTDQARRDPTIKNLQLPPRGAADVYVMQADGTGATRLTADLSNNEQPAWAPDGSRIAFTTNRDGDYEIYVMNADGTSTRRLTRVAGSDSSPSWSR